MNYIKLLRIKHWIKNLLLFLPIVCSGALFKWEIVVTVLCGVAAFCCLASAVYIINDICDKEKDCLHEKKKYRPIASEVVSVKEGIVVAIFLLVLALVFHSLAAGLQMSALIMFILYFVINLGYSVGGLKKVPLLDIVLLASGFLIRVMYGAEIADLQISTWLYLVIVTGAFYLGFGERRNELYVTNITRDVLKEYTVGYLDRCMMCAQTLSITFYALWCLEKGKNSLSGFIWTVPVLMIAFFIYGLDIEKNSDGDPVNVILKDKRLIAVVGVFVITLLMLLY